MYEPYASATGSPACPSRRVPSQSDGVGIVASKQNGPVTRVMPLCTSGRSTRISSAWRFIIGDRFQRDMRHDAADFLALAVLLALIDEPARPARAIHLSIDNREKSQ